MQWVETTARTVEEAKEAALDQLGVDEADAEFEVIEEPRPGLFGRIRGQARVRARVRPTTPRPKSDRRDRRRRGGRTEGSGPAGPAGSATAVVTEQPERNERTERTDRADRGERPARGERAERGERRAGRTARPAAPEPEALMTETVDLEADKDMATEFVDGLLEAFGVDADVAASIVEDEVEVSVTGENLGLLIGPRGQTLAALQELTRTVVHRQAPGRSGWLRVDVAGYRQRRKAALERFTRDLAEQVKATGERKVLEPMGAADRKVVHDTAQDIAGVTTLSEGEEPHRRVVILPES